MNKITCLLAFLLIISFSVANAQNCSKPKQVIISGKVLNFNPENKIVSLYVNLLGLSSMQVDSELDSIGNFLASFNIYIPTDVWLTYNMNFLVLVHPGDSIHVEFDGSMLDRPDILKTVKFSGDAANVNQDAAAFQYMYFSNHDHVSKKSAKKEYDSDKYILYLDTMKQKRRQIYENFISEHNPNEESKIWALTYIEEDYYDALSFYPSDHLAANNLNCKIWNVPISYYNPLKNRLPITKPMLISGYALSGFINRYHYYFVRNNIWEEEANKKLINAQGVITGPTNIVDSIIIHGIIKYTPDTLLRQMVLTEMFVQNFENFEIGSFEKYRSLVDLYIKEPYLKEPLYELYDKTKERIEHPDISMDAVLRMMDSSSINQIMDSILLNNKGKIIYLDCWATWCGPCRAEMPGSKKLMKQMDEKEVAFVYLCVDSEEKLWKSGLDEFQLEGQHYFLTKTQSSDFRKIFEVNGIPHYFLFDKNGTIIYKGSYLRPDFAKEKIEELLKK